MNAADLDELEEKARKSGVGIMRPGPTLTRAASKARKEFEKEKPVTSAVQATSTPLAFAPTGFGQLAAGLMQAAPVVAGEVSAREFLSSVSDAVMQLVGGKAAPVKREIFAGKKATGFADAVRERRVWNTARDAMPRFEIPDRESKFKVDTKAGSQFKGKLSDAFDHSELYKNYPHFANYPLDLKFVNDPKKVSGNYSPAGKRLTVAATSADEARSIILHELQHAVQEVENFAAGGSTGMMEEVIQRNFKLPGFRFIPPVDNRNPPTSEDLKNIPSVKELTNIMRAAGELKENELPKLPPHYNLYLSLLGEAEARQIEARRNFTVEDILKIPPWRQPFDVTPSKLLGYVREVD